MEELASPIHAITTVIPESKTRLFVTPLGEKECITHDGYIQIGIFKHSVEKHLELNPMIDWQVTYWYPDIFMNRYKRVTFQQHMACNEGSPQTDNAGGGVVDLCETRPRDFPDVRPSGCSSLQPEERLNRAV